jgi:hypothetical protein
MVQINWNLNEEKGINNATTLFDIFKDKATADKSSVKK